MSDKTPETPNKADNDQTKRAHYYDDGNITLSLKGMVLFKVHKSILSLHSQTFKDMFSLPNVPSTTENQDDPVVVDDDPDTFRKLLDCMYRGINFTQDATPQDHLRILKLARKYEMDELENQMECLLKSKLPSFVEAALLVPESLQPYEKDPLLAQAVLDSGVKELMPWAFYSLGVHIISAINTEDKSMYDFPSILSTLGYTYIGPLLILQQVIGDTFIKWNKQIDEFYTAGCSSVPTRARRRRTSPSSRSRNRSRSSDSPTRCSRSSRPFDHNSPLDLSTVQKQVDPVKLMIPRIEDLTNKMADQSGDYHRSWCTKCIKSLREITINIVLELYPYLVECVARLDRY